MAGSGDLVRVEVSFLPLYWSGRQAGTTPARSYEWGVMLLLGRY